MTWPGQEVLEVFVTERADHLHHDHVDRHHREQLLEKEKECTLNSGNGIRTETICISVINVIRDLSVISDIICFKCNKRYNYVISVVLYNEMKAKLKCVIRSYKSYNGVIRVISDLMVPLYTLSPL